MRRDNRPATARAAALALLVGLATLLAFWPAGGHGFLRYDDAAYVVDNPNVRAGLTPAGIRWALTSFFNYNWHPLTWVSHMLDVSLFGLQPRGHHLVNVLLHAANAALLFAVLSRMTGATAAPALVAALFALHPLHVESVAWVAERKDLLAALFWILALGAWLRYARRPGPGRYAAAAGLFALALLSKPMAVTLPLVLLLLDVWPLGRVPLGAGTARAVAATGRLLGEKVPLVALSAATAWLTYRAQAGGGAVWEIPLPARLGNAVVSLAAYVGKMLWPSPLAVFYPHPAQAPPPAQVLAALALVALATAGAARAVRRFPWLLLGWAWYLVTVLPVLGLVQVGRQAMADRYTYLPLVGLFTAGAWTAVHAAGSRRTARAALALCAAALVGACAVATRAQLALWTDGVTLFSHALRVTPDNAEARFNLGSALLEEGRVAEAVVHLERAVALDPSYPEARQNLGRGLLRARRIPEAIAQLERAVALDPAYLPAYNDLGLALSRGGLKRQAAETYRRAIARDPAYTEPYRNLALLQLSLGDRGGACATYEALRRADPAAAAALAPFVAPPAGR